MKRGEASEESEQAREEIVKDVNGQILRDGVEVRRRWAEYFEHAGPECGRCHGGKYQCIWQLADACVRRFE